ncbi:MAG: immune inhibitor A [Anaerolineae bacterium]|nr:immune inhibitor A [Anaerolineae bacterium]
MIRQTICQLLRRRGAGPGLSVILTMLASLLLIPTPAHAQDGKRADEPTWADAPIVPRHCSQADWLVDVGWKTPGEVFGPFPTHEYEVEETEQFHPLGAGSSTPETFYLRYRTEHAYFWFERGVRVNPSDLEATARFFEEHIWPLNNMVFGGEQNPGIDGDPRLHILNQAFIGASVMGAFSPQDQCPRSICPESNQREIIYINLDLAPLYSQAYLTTLAHEYQHLIQHHADGNETRWLNEGLSQLAEHLNGFDPHYIGGGNVLDFLREPDHHLNGWASDQLGTEAYYGAGYLFLVYLYERFGLDFIHLLSSSDYDGLAAVQYALTKTGQDTSVDGVFADWIVANYLDDPYVDDGRYYYQTLDLPLRIRPDMLNQSDLAYPYVDTVNQYGADYMTLIEPGVYDISFDGSNQVNVIGTAPRSGDWMWWSYNNINGAARLTGAFDLTGLDMATLTFNMWWHTEKDYDWLQVLVSGNGGQDWQIAPGRQAADGGPEAPGAHYSGQSGSWIEEQIDLSAFAGGPVLIRFEYLTDGSHNMVGVALDNIGLPELGYRDDVENPATVWHPEGFIRIPDALTQGWTIAIVTERRGEHASVDHLALDSINNTERTTIIVPEGSTATIIIGAMAPFTARRADYKLTIQPREF